jgi:hypothetical protein
MMRGILLLLIMLAITPSCSQSRPVANLTFVEATNGVSHIKLRYRSDIDFDAVVDPAGNRKVVSRRLLCALEADQDFSVDHVIERYGAGEVIKQRVLSPTAIEYVTPVYFLETHDKDTTRQYIRGEKLKIVLGNREKMPCKVVMTIYLSSAYYSATMWIPISEIRKVLPRDFPVPIVH